MGPLRFELRSEDPQSPRMARLPYGPALLLLDHFIYLACYNKKDLSIYQEKYFIRLVKSISQIFTSRYPVVKLWSLFLSRQKKICI